MKALFALVLLAVFAGCADRILPDPDATNVAVKPRVVTTALAHDTDDPAIWINRADPAKSLVIGTDKGDSTGGLYVFTLDGRIDSTRTRRPLKRPNNVDVITGVPFNGKRIDIAVAAEINVNIHRRQFAQDIDPPGHRRRE